MLLCSFLFGDPGADVRRYATGGGLGGWPGPGKFRGECAVGGLQALVLFLNMFVGCFEVKDSFFEKTCDDALELVKPGGVRDELGLFIELHSEGLSYAGSKSFPTGSPGALPSCEDGGGRRSSDRLDGAGRVGVRWGGPSSDPARSGRGS